jgi:hypothetical protein
MEVALLSLLSTAGLVFAEPPVQLPISTQAAPAPSLPTHGVPFVPPKGGSAPHGYLWFYLPDGKGGTTKRVIPYCPREGDIIFFDDMSKVWEKLFALAGTTPPFHTGIVVKKPDGCFAVLESGPDDTLYVSISNIVDRLYHFKGILQVRQARKVLCPEESAQLTAFARAQEGKHYALWRLLLQGTPCRLRNGLTEKYIAKTHLDRNRWLCTEIVVAAGTLVGLFDDLVKGNACYPLDMLDDQHKYNLGKTYELPGYWAPHP